MSKYLIVSTTLSTPKMREFITSRDLGRVVDGFVQIFKIEDDGKVLQMHVKEHGNRWEPEFREVKGDES